MAANTISKLAQKVVDDLFTEYPAMFVAVSKAAYVNALQQSLNAIVQTDIKLDRTSPDYESVMIRLMQALSNIPAWYDLITPSTSSAIIRMIASNVAYGQYSIERAYQEAFLSSASSESGIFSGVRMLGIRPQRRQPSRVLVQLTRPEAINILTLPAFSTFSVGDQKFFNREAIVFNINVFTTSKQLFQGVVQNEIITSDGEPFQKYTIGDGERNASDVDITLTIDGKEWERSPHGMQEFGRDEQIYNENTSQSGDIELNFGNGDFGRIPPLSSQLNLTWVKTLGKDADVAASGIAVKMDDPPVNITITGITTTNIENGAESITSRVYKKIAPSLYAAQGRAVRREDYKANAILFPGVYDALFRGQAELAPGRRSMMNVVGYTLLTDSNWTLADYKNFEDYFNAYLSIYRLEFLRIQPIPIVQNVTATLYCNPDVDLQQVYDDVIDLVAKLYTPRVNYLGRSMFLTDISDVLNGRNADDPNERLEQQINYVVLDPAMKDIVIVDPRTYVKLGTVTLTMKYTTRDGYSGRLDIAPNQANTVTTIFT